MPFISIFNSEDIIPPNHYLCNIRGNPIEPMKVKPTTFDTSIMLVSYSTR